MADEEIQKEEPLPKQSLYEFIETFQKTLATVGVLIALGIFWKTLYTNETPYISYLCFLGTLPLLFEIVRSYEYHKSSWNLRLFGMIMAGILFQSALFIFTNYLEHTASLISGLLWTAFCLTSFFLLDKWATHSKESKYEKAVVEAEEIHSRKDLTQEVRNQIVTLKNEILQSHYRFVNRSRLILTIISILISLVLFAWVDEFLHGAVDLTKPIPEIPETK